MCPGNYVRSIELIEQALDEFARITPNIHPAVRLGRGRV
jgi:hypothetical protein